MAIRTGADFPRAGVLKLFPGLFGVGHFDIDSARITTSQLRPGLFGIFFSLFCFVRFPVLLGGTIWAIVDAILRFIGGVKDNHGRKTRRLPPGNSPQTVRSVQASGSLAEYPQHVQSGEGFTAWMSAAP